MKPKFKKFNWLVKLITFNYPLVITLFPFGIYVNQKYITLDNLDEDIKNHEKIHWVQQIEFFVVGIIISLLSLSMFVWVSFHWWIILIIVLFPFLFFYIWYLIEWIIRIFINGNKAYVSISFEREAYNNDYKLNYLNNRKHFSHFKYMIK